VIGAAAVCMRSFPANKVILGNPAKVAMPIPSIDDREPKTAEGLPVPVMEDYPPNEQLFSPEIT
jgi:serine acetyltransferase